VGVGAGGIGKEADLIVPCVGEAGFFQIEEWFPEAQGFAFTAADVEAEADDAGGAVADDLKLEFHAGLHPYHLPCPDRAGMARGFHGERTAAAEIDNVLVESPEERAPAGPGIEKHREAA